MATMSPFEVLRARMAGDEVGGARLALVLEGGGMRGVISAAMAGVLESVGAHRHVDLFVGTSAGATFSAGACFTYFSRAQGRRLIMTEGSGAASSSFTAWSQAFRS